MSLPNDDPRLTAFLLGELDDGEARQLREELASHTELSEELKALQGVSEELRQELVEEIAPGLTDDQLYALQNRIDLIERQDGGGGAIQGAGPRWYMRLELWMPVSAAIGFLVALLIFASTTPWLVEGIRGRDDDPGPVNIGPIPEVTDPNQWEKDQQEWKPKFWPKLQGQTAKVLMEHDTETGASYAYIDRNPWINADRPGVLRVPFRRDDRALTTILERLESGVRPIPEMLRFEQMLAGMSFSEYEMDSVLWMDSPWDPGQRLCLFVIKANDAGNTGDYLWIAHHADEPFSLYRLMGYGRRYVQAGQNDLGDWSLASNERVAVMLQQSTGAKLPNTFFAVSVTKAWKERGDFRLLKLSEQPSAMVKAILLRSLLDRLSEEPGEFALSDEQIQAYLESLPEDEDRAVIERLKKGIDALE